MVPLTYLAFGIHVLMIFALALLIIKRVADMDEYFGARLFVIGVILSFTAIIILVAYHVTPSGEPQIPCPEDHFCTTEM